MSSTADSNPKPAKVKKPRVRKRPSGEWKIYKWTMGKYKGQYIKDTPVDYIQWALRTGENPAFRQMLKNVLNGLGEKLSEKERHRDQKEAMRREDWEREAEGRERANKELLELLRAKGIECHEDPEGGVTTLFRFYDNNLKVFQINANCKFSEANLFKISFKIYNSNFLKSVCRTDDGTYSTSKEGFAVPIYNKRRKKSATTELTIEIYSKVYDRFNNNNFICV